MSTSRITRRDLGVAKVVPAEFSIPFRLRDLSRDHHYRPNKTLLAIKRQVVSREVPFKAGWRLFQ
jgi:hypothetical protein